MTGIELLRALADLLETAAKATPPSADPTTAPGMYYFIDKDDRVSFKMNFLGEFAAKEYRDLYYQGRRVAVLLAGE